MLALLLALAGPANAEKATRGPRFVLVVRDEGGRLYGKEVSARIGDDGLELPLRDDGLSPDLAAGDDVYSADVDGQPGEAIPIVVVAGGEQVASDTASIPTDMSLPSIRIVLAADGSATWRVQSDQPVNTGEKLSLPSAQGSSASAPGLSSVARPMSLGLASGLVLGALGLVVARRPRKQPALPRPPSPSALVLPETPLLLRAPDTRGSTLVIEALAAALRSTHAPLVVASTTLRGRLSRSRSPLAGVHQLDQDHPTVDRVLAAATALDLQGPALLLVEGSGALEAPEAKEEPHIVVTELAELARCALVVVADPSQAMPPGAVDLAEVEGELRGAGLRFWRDEAGAARVAAQA